jgi:hypothetical protein
MTTYEGSPPIKAVCRHFLTGGGAPIAHVRLRHQKFGGSAVRRRQWFIFHFVNKNEFFLKQLYLYIICFVEIWNNRFARCNGKNQKIWKYVWVY